MFKKTLQFFGLLPDDYMIKKINEFRRDIEESEKLGYKFTFTEFGGIFVDVKEVLADPIVKSYFKRAEKIVLNEKNKRSL